MHESGENLNRQILDSFPQMAMCLADAPPLKIGSVLHETFCDYEPPTMPKNSNRNKEIHLPPADDSFVCPTSVNFGRLLVSKPSAYA